MSVLPRKLLISNRTTIKMWEIRFEVQIQDMGGLISTIGNPKINFIIWEHTVPTKKKEWLQELVEFRIQYLSIIGTAFGFITIVCPSIHEPCFTCFFLYLCITKTIYAQVLKLFLI